VFATMKIPSKLFATALVACLFLTKASAISPGDTLPALAVSNDKGATIAVDGAGAKLTYIDFWASWCTPCKQSFPWMDAMSEKYGNRGFRVVAISVDKKREDADKFLRQAATVLRANDAAFAVGFDPEGKTAAALQVKAMPTSLLVDEKGKVIFVHSGFKAADTDALEAQIKTALDAANAVKK
jgi:cytochrome c biogenesis protein CcmG, thiol:disulfide interchange protein DsbE